MNILFNLLLVIILTNSLFAQTDSEKYREFAKNRATKEWNKNNKPTNILIKKMVKQILLKKLGIKSKGMTQDIVESIMNENDYAKLVVSYNDNNMEQFGKDLAILAGKKIVKVVTKDSNSKFVLGSLTKHASKVEAVIKMGIALKKGDLKGVAKELSNEIINSFPMTKFYREAAKVIKNKILSWKNEGVERAYRVFTNGSEFNSEAGNFDDLWNDMEAKPNGAAIIRQLRIDARKECMELYKDSSKCKNIEDKVKETLRKRFSERAKQDREIEKMTEQNMKYIEKCEKMLLLRKGFNGYGKNSTLDSRLEKLFKMKDIILKNPKNRDMNEFDITQRIQKWYRKRESKKKDIIRKNVLKRISKLNHAKMLALLKRLGKNPPKNYFECLCGVHSVMGNGYGYYPNGRGECEGGHGVCLGGNWGCSFAPLPNEAKKVQNCIEKAKYPGNMSITDIIVNRLYKFHEENNKK